MQKSLLEIALPSTSGLASDAEAQRFTFRLLLGLFIERYREEMSRNARLMGESTVDMFVSRFVQMLALGRAESREQIAWLLRQVAPGGADHLSHEAQTVALTRLADTFAGLYADKLAEQAWDVGKSLSVLVALRLEKSMALRLPSFGIVSQGPLWFDLDRNTLLYRGRLIRLSHTDWQLLLILASTSDYGVSRQAIVATIWPGQSKVEDRLYEAVRTLRLKLRGCDGITIKVQHGWGYLLDLDPA